MTSYFFEHMDQYCERLSFSLFAEPFNLLSNLGFILAALACYQLAKRRQGNVPRHQKILIYNLFIIGIGSALFHSFANRITHIADILPIAVFVLLYAGFTTRFLLSFTKPQMIYCLGILIGLTVFSILLSGNDLANGSSNYLGAVAMIFVMAYIAKKAGLRRTSRHVLLGGICICVALVFRPMDQAVCASFPVGTHFLWHSFNAVGLFFLVAAHSTGSPAKD